MKPKTRPWLIENSILHYVRNNMDEDGFFIGDNLPRGEYALINPAAGLELGGGDAFVIMNDGTDDKKTTEVVYKALKDFITVPNEKKRDNLYQLISFTQCVSYCESLADRLNEEELPEFLLELTLEWLRYSPSREAVKFAVVVMGLFGLDSDIIQDKEGLKEDLRLLARCDEFTYFVIFAFALSNSEDELDLWEIIQTTYGWGRVHAMEAYEYTTSAEKDWLLRHGCEIDVRYPALSLLCIKEGNMMTSLQKPEIDEELYRGILHALNNYLDFLLELDSTDGSYPDFGPVNTFGLMREVLRHAQGYSNSIESLVDVVNLANNLQRLAEEERWETIDANACHLLIGMAEKLIYRKDWMPEISNEIVNPDGSINYTAIEFARALKMDIWELLAALLRQDPLRTRLYSYLLDTNDEDRYQLALSFARASLELYEENEHALEPIIKSLETRPGFGEDLLIKALTSIYDWPRSCALDVLDAWGVEYLTPELRAALLQALNLAQHTLLTMRIKSLLDNKVLDLEDVIKLMALE